MTTFTIGVLAARADVTPEAVRYWERIGVLEPASRNAQGHRKYGDGHVREVELLKAAQALGFSLDEIRRLLRLARSAPVPCRDVRALAEPHLARLEARIAELEEARARLAGALGGCEPDTLCLVACEPEPGCDPARLLGPGE